MTTDKGVKESTTGTTPEAKGRAQVTPEAKGGTPESASKVSPEAPKSYSQEEVDKLFHAIESEHGREKKDLEVKVSTLEKQLVSKTQELTDNATEIENLEAKMSEITKDSPEGIDFAKEMKVLREERRQLKAELAGVNESKASIEQSKQEIAKWNRDQLVFRVADEYVTASGESVDFDTFMVSADRFKLGDEESLKALAETMGLKPKTAPKETEPKAPPLKLFSGVTQGGGPQSEEERLKSRYPKMLGK